MDNVTIMCEMSDAVCTLIILLMIAMFKNVCLMPEIKNLLLLLLNSTKKHFKGHTVLNGKFLT